MRFYFLLFIFLFGKEIFAQNNLLFRHLTNEDGLSQNSVYAICQDHFGFIWVGTSDGLNRYDGHRFKVYRNNRLDSSSISNSAVRSIYEDPQGNLWIGTRSGFNRFDRKTETFEHFPLPDGTQVGSINQIYADSEGYLWLASWDNGLLRFDPRTQTYLIYAHDDKDPNSLPRNWVFWVTEDPNRLFMWISFAGEGGFGKLNKKTGKFTGWKNDPQNSNSLPSNNVGSFLRNSDGTFWLPLTGAGLTLFDPKNGSSKKFFHDPTNPYSLVGKNVEVVYKDSKGQIWIGGSDGLSLMQQNADSIYFINYKHSPQDAYSLSNNYVYRLFEDDSGVLWFGTYNGGLNYIDLYKKDFQLYQFDAFNPKSLPYNNIRSVLEDKKGNLWVGLNDVALCWATPAMRKEKSFRTYRYSPDSVLKFQVYNMFQDQQEQIWLGTWGNGMVKLIEKEKNGHFAHTFIPVGSNPEDSIKMDTERIRYIFQDSKQRLWVGGLNQGLWKYNTEKEYFERFLFENEKITSSRCMVEDKNGVLWLGTEKGLIRLDLQKNTKKVYIPTDDPNSLSNERINDLHFDKNGILWIATTGGLNILDTEKEIFSSITDLEGFESKSIYGILEDDLDNLWLSTNAGLYKFSKKEMSFVHFDISDGLQNNEFNLNAFHRSQRTGELFFGGIGGLNAFFSEKIKKSVYQAPILLTDFKILGKSVEVFGEKSVLDVPIWLAQEIELSYQDYMFSFDFASLHFSKSKNALFRYKLEGFSEDWIQVAADRAFAIFTNIPHGTYILRVQGTNADGVWSRNEAQLKVIIRPPFWKTWWFVLLSLLSSGFVAYQSYNYRIRIIKEQKNNLERIVIERTSEVVKQKEEIEHQNRDIRASINYAKTIQRATLPSKTDFKAALPNSFVFFKPRDVVSGDFYWLHQNQDYTVVAAVDCTGHGVPGAFMSMIGSNFLHEIVKVRQIYEPKHILEMLHKGIQSTLNQQQTNNRDGMDAAICCIKENTLLFGGAKNGLILIKNKELDFVKGSKFSVGGSQNEQIIEFEQYQTPIDQDLYCYIFSDGYQDQFGGKDDRKFMSKRFRELIFEIHQNDFDTQKRILYDTFENWKAQTEQIDDVLVIGFKISPSQKI